MEVKDVHVFGKMKAAKVVEKNLPQHCAVTNARLYPLFVT
jgi:hypothetical protein